LRGKALTLLFTISGIREGSIENARVPDYTDITDENKRLEAARLIVYL
jgi:hypothetical protein